MRYLIFLFSPLFMTNTFAMQSLDDELLADYTGQALYRLEDTNNVLQPDGSTMDFTKLTLGLKIEQNINIEAIRLGKYYRPNATDARLGVANSQVDIGAGMGADIEGRNFTYDTQNRWNCSVIKCGGIDGTYAVSGLMYSAVFTDVSLFGHKDFVTFQSGFDPENVRGQYDVILRDATMGYVNDLTGEIVDMVAERPYIEMAYKTIPNPDNPAEQIRTVQGFRFGFEKQNGVMGNAIDVFSGFLKPKAEITATIIGLDLNLKIEPNITGVRTPGYIHPNNSTYIEDCGGALSIACGLLNLESPEGLAGTAKEGQAFPLQSINLVNATDFFFAVQKSAIQYPNNPSGSTPAHALPGFWINMGGDDGLQVDNQAPHHPDNYFPGNPLHLKYNGSANNSGVPGPNNIVNGYYN